MKSNYKAINRYDLPDIIPEVGFKELKYNDVKTNSSDLVSLSRKLLNDGSTYRSKRIFNMYRKFYSLSKANVIEPNPGYVTVMRSLTRMFIDTYKEEIFKIPGKKEYGITLPIVRAKMCELTNCTAFNLIIDDNVGNENGITFHINSLSGDVNRKGVGYATIPFHITNNSIIFDNAEDIVLTMVVPTKFMKTIINKAKFNSLAELRKKYGNNKNFYATNEVVNSVLTKLGNVYDNMIFDSLICAVYKESIIYNFINSINSRLNIIDVMSHDKDSEDKTDNMLSYEKLDKEINLSEINPYTILDVFELTTKEVSDFLKEIRKTPTYPYQFNIVPSHVDLLQYKVNSSVNRDIVVLYRLYLSKILPFVALREHSNISLKSSEIITHIEKVIDRSSSYEYIPGVNELINEINKYRGYIELAFNRKLKLGY